MDKPLTPVDPTIPCQRWNRRRDSYRPAGEPINVARYGVAPISEAMAKPWVKAHHYSGSYPVARSRIGLWESTGPFTKPELVGVAVYSVPMSQRVLPKWTGVEDTLNAVELGRLVLLDRVAGNGESWFLSRAHRAMAAELPMVRAIMSCSDPVKRRNTDGTVVMPGHVGCIYQAMNARHVGRTGRATLNLTPDGQVVSKRAISKVVHGETGVDYVQRQLQAMGAPARQLHEDGGAYIRRLKSSGWLGRFRHPGNLVYVWAVGPDKRARKAATRSFKPALAYPKAASTVVPMTITRMAA